MPPCASIEHGLAAGPARWRFAGRRLPTVEVASVSDAIEQLYGQRAYMSHEMRPLAATKFAGPAVTVQLKKEEHKEGSAASQGMLDAIDDVPRRVGLRDGPGERRRTTPASAA